MKVSQIVLATGLVGQATATWNLFGNPFNSPQYNNNECSDKQKGGFDWSDLKDGDTNFNYGDFDFTGGWKCSNSFGKRDHLTRRTFGSKCIKNKVNKQKPASFGCNKRKSGFSITHIDVSVEFDVDLELHYHMEDGSKCKQVAPCKSSGSTIQNTQCGGAKSVDVYLPKHDKSDKDCEIGFHNIGFDCNPGQSYNPPSPPSPPTQKPSPPSPPVSSAVSSAVVSSPAPPSTTSSCSGEKCGAKPPSTTGAAPPCKGKDCSATSAPATEVSTAPPKAPTPPATECGGYGQDSCDSTTDVASPPVETPTLATGPPYVNSSAPAATTPPAQKTSSIDLPPASPPASSAASSAPACDGSYGNSCESASTAVTTAVILTTSTALITPSSSIILTTGGSPQPSSPAYSPVSPPDVLPKCMNTWLEVSGNCKNNADASCYCKNKDFTKQVIDCVSAWCGTDEETRQSLQYLIGICAEHVPENPGLVTDCPSYIPLNPSTTAAAPPAGGASTPAGETGSTPATTPAPQAPGSSQVPSGETPAAPSTPCTTITMGSTTLTIPQVHFTTQTNEGAGAQPTEPVGLVPGNAPPSTPATTTAPYPISGPGASSTLATFKPTGTGAYSPTSPPEFTGAAAPFKLDAKHAVLGAVLAFFAL
ncbi:hypothetical protein E8E13_006744 [Curvularia kusanoi]|uniref:CFEM domain-containing protein n=1 Tax=Curvularia kusanoi TaxID=90978 RepID=A0A9P4W8F7_CURKU|nr:hypothetical protein E8E13_006744 [Curvularia kusanoi]